MSGCVLFDLISILNFFQLKMHTSRVIIPSLLPSLCQPAWEYWLMDQRQHAHT